MSIDCSRLSHVAGPCAILLVLVTPVLATTTRIAGLGGEGDYLTDESNVRRWYASLAGQENLLLVEPGTLNLDAGGAAWNQRVSEKGGGLFLRADSTGRAGTFAAYFTARPDDGTPGGGIAVQYGRAWGRLGAGLAIRATSSMSDLGNGEPDFTGRADYIHVVGAGLSAQVARRTSLEVAGEIVNSQFTMNEFGLGSGQDNSWRGFGLRARGKLPGGEAVTIVPVFDYWRDDRITYTTVLPDVAHRDAWQWRAGIGAVGALSPTRMLVVSAEYRDGKENFDGYGLQTRFSNSRRDYWDIQWRIGFETRALRWLQVRLGAEYRRVTEGYIRWSRVDWDQYVEVEEAQNVRVETPLTLGCTATAGDLFLDLALADGTPSSATFLRAENGLADNAHLMAATIGWKF